MQGPRETARVTIPFGRPVKKRIRTLVRTDYSRVLTMPTATLAAAIAGVRYPWK
jgi:hypothetical protein